jgi:hypothetical protein
VRAPRVFFLGITRSANVNKNVLRPKTEQAGCIFLNNTSSQNHSLALIFNKAIFPRRKKQHANFHQGKKSPAGGRCYVSERRDLILTLLGLIEKWK